MEQYLVGNLSFPEGWHTAETILSHSKLRVAFSLHPHCASKPGSLDKVRELGKLLDTPGCVALAEVGLDHDRWMDVGIQERQERLLRAQLQLARAKYLPVVIHCRDDPQQPGKASTSCRKIVVEELPPGHPLMLHCFLGTVGDMRAWDDAYPGAIFSISPKALSQARQEWKATKAGLGDWRDHHGTTWSMIRALPLDRMVLESDAPLLTPPGFQRPGHPWLIAEVSSYVARVRNMAPSMVLEVTRKNAQTFFRLP